MIPKVAKRMYNKRIRNIWNNMHQRCSNPNAPNYKYYGAKGVCVCSQWKKFTEFYEWAIANGYEDHLTIDRIDSTGNYELSNCRWATYKVQQNNSSHNHLYSYNGETHTISQWAEISGIYPNTLYKRLNRGWDIEKSLTTKSLTKWGKNYNGKLNNERLQSI